MIKQSRLETIREIAVRNEIPFLEAMEYFTKCMCKIYTKEYKKNREHQLYNPVLEEKIFRITDRYIGIKKWRDLKNGK